MKKMFDLAHLRELAISDASVHNSSLSLTEHAIVKFLRNKDLEALSYISETEDAEVALELFSQIFNVETIKGELNIVDNEINLVEHELDLDIILSSKIKSQIPEAQVEFLKDNGVRTISIQLTAIAGTYMAVPCSQASAFKDTWDKGVSVIKSLSLNNTKATQDFSKVAAMVVLGFSMAACSKDVSKIGLVSDTPSNPTSPIVDQPATDEKTVTALFANHAPVGSSYEIPSPFTFSGNVNMVIPQEITTTSFDKEKNHPNLLLTMDNLAIAEYRWNGSKYALSSVSSNDKVFVATISTGSVYALKVDSQSVLRTRYLPGGQTISVLVKYWEQ